MTPRFQLEPEEDFNSRPRMRANEEAPAAGKLWIISTPALA